jgi:23S rRNA pseudouridine1911/1915/1917 synthase
MSAKRHQKPSRSSDKPPTSLKVTESAELLKFLLAEIRHKSRNNIKTLLRDRKVRVDGQTVSQHNHRLQPQQQVEVSWKKIPEEKQYRGISIVFEDNDLIVIDKHAGVLSIATKKERAETAYSFLSRHVKKQNPANKIFVVHRLDRDTSGLMMFAKSEKIKRLLQDTWHTAITERTYVAVVEGAVEEPEGVITSYLKESKALIVYSSPNPDYGRKAVTHYRTIRSNKKYSMLKVNLETGRKHQVRVHMKDLGHSIVGDKKYGSTINPIGRIALHALVLAFIHPINKEPLRFETAMPRKLTKLFQEKNIP